MAAGACSTEALKSLLWVSPVAQDLLNTVSQLLAFTAPCPLLSLAQALRAADDADCAGLTRDVAVREALAAELGSGVVKEVCNGEAAALVEAMGAVLEEMVKGVHKAAAPILSKLASMDKMPSFKEVLSCLPAGQEPGEALQKDWLLWHTVGHVHSPELLPGPESKIVHERLALAACAGSGPLAEFVLALHTLENVEAYVAWERSLAGSQPAVAKRLDLKGQSVMFPFDEATAKEVSLRRVLGAFLPQSAAVSTATQVSESADVKAAVQALAATARSQAIIPMCAPSASKEPKQAKGPKEPKGSTEPKVPKEQPGGGTQRLSRPAMKPGAFGKMHLAAATQELQWHLLSYRLRPCTTLGAAAKASGASRAPAPGPAKGATSAASASAVVAAPVASKPKGFGGIWAPEGDGLPPGHTPVSWNGVKNKGGTKGFDYIWAPQGSELPPGHTSYSWEQVLTSSGTCTAAVPSSASAPAAAKPAAAPAAKATSKGQAKASEGGPEEGSLEADLCKLDLRCGRIRECSRVPDSDSLYLLKIDIGEQQPRQVVSSLVKHYGAEELQDRQVVVYCNIKPGKMRNFESQAMVLAAVKDKHEDHEKCELLTVPSGVPEGTRVMCGNLEVGSLSASQSVKQISKVWGRVQPLLLTNERCEATFSGMTLTLKESPVTAKSLGGVSIS